MKRLLVFLLLLFLQSSAFAQEEFDTVILIPTMYVGPGAFGSTWWSVVIITNHSDEPFESAPSFFRVQCVIPEGCTTPQLAPGQLGVLFSPRPANGLLLRTTTDIAANLAFSAHFGSGPFHFTNGSELPIVREHEFRTFSIHFPSVDLHNTFVPVRTHLRIYSIDHRLAPRVRVEVRPYFAPTSPTPLASKEIKLDVPVEPPGASPVFPAFAQLWLQNEFPLELLGGGSLHITVVPLPGDFEEVPRIWAMLSTTENFTQAVTLHTPQ